ncbi:sucrase ferredoxin [Pseudonocardia sp.]|uniref:sucrase ferredoxin n=1 Tax=Pseudonocardia sp. TaxID=60912 RepID=UPI00261C1E4A|nr:sucrase ferredoxin [Pseudonocardia sp.]
MTGPRCAEVADAAGDAREGTAPPAERWFLIEHPGPWGRVAFAESGLPDAVVAAADRWAGAHGGRVLLVRRPGRRPRRAGSRRWFRVDSRPGRESVRTGTVVHDDELVTALDDPGQPHDALHLVCAHGRHDTCCAVRGRPVAAALAAADPDRTWECSHVGGCRFAPALVLLPHGFVYGGMPAVDAVTLVKDHAAGLVDPRWLRGRSSLPPAVQAAQHHARSATGELGVDALRPVGLTSNGTRWRVELAGPGCVVELDERFVDAGRPLTCAAVTPGRMRVLDLVSLRVAGRC